MGDVSAFGTWVFSGRTNKTVYLILPSLEIDL